MSVSVNAAPAQRLSAFLDTLEAWCVSLTRPLAFLGVMGMLIVSGVTMVDILLRWLLSSGVTAMNEIVAMVFAITITACLPHGVALAINLKLDLLESWIIGRLMAWINVVGMALVLLLLSLLTWRLTIYAGTLAAEGRTTVILRWPQAPFIYAMTALFGLCALIQVVVLANALVKALVYNPGHGMRESSPLAWLFSIAIGVGLAALITWGILDFRTLSRFASANVGFTILIFCTVMWLLLLFLVPLSAVMGLMGIVGAALFIGFNPSLSAFATEVSGFLTNAQIAVLPLFLMMGSFAAVAGIADDMYALAHALLSRFPGGLAMATIGGCAGFGAMTGSTVATAALVGRVALPKMAQHGYSPALATGCVAAGGTLGNLVPPGSAPLVLFALLTESSLGQLFVASIIPSIIAIIGYLVTVLLYVYFVPSAAPVTVKPEPGELSAAVKRCGPVTTLFVAVLGGMYFGVFNSTEAAAVGAFGAFMVALFRGKLKPKQFWGAMAETTSTTALIYPLIFGALIFGIFTSVSGITETATKFVVGLGWEPLAVVALLLVVFLVLGTFMDSGTIMIVTIPIVTPLVTGVGYDIIWWGILNLFVVEIGGISPPFGLTMYVLKGFQNVSMATIFKGVMPFCFAAIVVLIILALFPSITLWLPSTMIN